MEGPPAGQHLVEDDPEREEVGALIARLAAHLFGRHIADRAHHRSRIGHARHADGGVATRRRRNLAPGETKVENLAPLVACDEQVLGLEISVEDPAIVRRRQAAGELDGVVDDLPQRQRTLVEPLAQRLPFQQLHHRVRHARAAGFGRRRADVVDRHDVGMRERGDRLRFTLEPRGALGIGGEELGQDLDRDRAIEPRVARLVDLTHTAGAERTQDFVGTETLAGGDGHVGGAAL
jgi:hypothetical protein